MDAHRGVEDLLGGAGLDGDLNTPLALAELHEVAGALNKAKEERERRALAGSLRAGSALLGLLWENPETWFQGGEAKDGLSAETIEAMIEARSAARKARDFGEADRIRDSLQAQGILLDDGPAGTTWKRAD